jgi:hypothetical protein
LVSQTASVPLASLDFLMNLRRQIKLLSPSLSNGNALSASLYWRSSWFSLPSLLLPSFLTAVFASSPSPPPEVLREEEAVAALLRFDQSHPSPRGDLELPKNRLPENLDASRGPEEVYQRVPLTPSSPLLSLSLSLSLSPLCLSILRCDVFNKVCYVLKLPPPPLLPLLSRLLSSLQVWWSSNQEYSEEEQL